MLDVINEIKLLWGEYGAWTIIAILLFVEFKYKPLRRAYKALDMLEDNNKLHQSLSEKVEKVQHELSAQIQDLRSFVVHELSYNGQSSTKDAVARTEQLVSRIAAQTHVGMELNPYGIFMCDFTGANFYVNRTYAHMVGVTKEELIGAGWANFVGDQDYSNNYKEAFQNKRDFTTETTIVTMSGETISVKILATVLQGLDGYMGYVIPIKYDDNIHASPQAKQKTPSSVSN